MTRQQAAKEAVEKAGSASKLARSLLGETPSDLDVQRMTWRVLKWMQDGKGVPPEYVLKVESLTGVSRHRLHPEVFPEDSAA